MYRLSGVGRSCARRTKALKRNYIICTQQQWYAYNTGCRFASGRRLDHHVSPIFSSAPRRGGGDDAEEGGGGLDDDDVEDLDVFLLVSGSELARCYKTRCSCSKRTRAHAD